MDLQSKVLARFASGSDKVVYVVPDDGGVVVMIQRVANRLGLKTFHLIGSEIGDRDALFEVLNREMSFPEYFGRNWDALEECLSDLAWMPALGYIILFEEPHHLMETSYEVFITFLEIMIAVAKRWAADQVPFSLVLVGNQMLLRLERHENIKHHIEFLN
jgi:RNAse (barnase) inhibitor barstar